MSGSYRRIDYRLRPAKYAERLMLCDAFRRLHFAAVDSYQYVGMGSVYFADFSLFHRMLGIQKMFSIENAAPDERQRFGDNLPFSNVQLRFGPSGVELPKIDLGQRSIIWLDYDGRLSRSILNDIADVVSRMASGSAIIITVQAEPPQPDATNSKKFLEFFKSTVGANHVPIDIVDDDAFAKWGHAAICRRIISNQISEAIQTRNRTRPRIDWVEYEQLFNFNYADGAKMATVGGIVYDAAQRHIMHACRFDDLSFVKKAETPFLIEMPKLTLRELKKLDQQMPLAEGENFNLGSIPEKDAEQFKSIYRYFPLYSVAEF